MFIEQVIEDAEKMNPEQGVITTYRYSLDLNYTSEQIEAAMAKLLMSKPDLVFSFELGKEKNVPYFYIEGRRKN